MKNLICFLTLSLMLWNCKKESIIEIVPELKVKIEKYGLVYVTNDDINAVKFSVDFGDGSIVIDNIETFPLYNYHKYEVNKQYTIILTTWNSYNNKKVVSKVITINDIPPKPIADFTVELVENGGVQCKNLSKNILNFTWYVNGYKSNTENPLFIFEKNGEYEILLQVKNIDDIISNKKAVIKISNAKEPSEVAEFKGIYFDKKGTFKGTNFNDFYGPRGAIALPDLIPSCIFGASEIDIRIVNFSGKAGYENLKKILTTGKKNIYGKNNNYIDWYFAFQSYKLFLSDALTSELEIIEVQEIDQPKLIPEMYDKAFWVTFKIKADFGNGNNIDGTLKVRYLIY